MSKLYKKYVLYKINNPNKIYLFECGIFYIFIDEDARIMSNTLNLKLTPLNSVIMKCGFPIKSADKYLTTLKNLNYDIEIIPLDEHSSPITLQNYMASQNIQNIIHSIVNLNIESLSISESFDFLKNLQNQLSQFDIEEKNKPN